MRTHQTILAYFLKTGGQKLERKAFIAVFSAGRSTGADKVSGIQRFMQVLYMLLCTLLILKETPKREDGDSSDSPALILLFLEHGGVLIHVNML